MIVDIQHKLILIRVRQLVAELCRRSGHGRLWFYRVLCGEASVLAELTLLDEILAKNPPTNKIAILREEASVASNQVIDRAELAKRLKVSRQTVSLWESQADIPAERLVRVRKALMETVVPINGDS